MIDSAGHLAPVLSVCANMRGRPGYCRYETDCSGTRSVANLPEPNRWRLRELQLVAIGDGIGNVGVGEDVTIGELAEFVREVVGFEGGIVFDATKPDGTPRKLLDVSRLRGLGWKAKIDLRQGMADTYRWCLENVENASLGNASRHG